MQTTTPEPAAAAPPWRTLSELADESGWSTRVLLKWVHNGRIRGAWKQPGRTGAWVVPVAECDRILVDHPGPRRPAP